MQTFLEGYAPNVRELAEVLFIGPQGELLEQLETINTRYGHVGEFSLGITPKFRWKPGTYDKVRYLLSDLVGFHSKTSGITRVIDKMGNGQWQVDRFRRDVASIETTLCNFRRDGIQWQDNSDILVETLSNTKEKMAEQLELAQSIKDVDINILYDRHAGVDDNSRRNDSFIISLNFKNIEISLLNGDNNNVIVGKIPYHGEIELKIKINIMRFLNCWAGNSNFTSNALPRNIAASHYGDRHGNNTSMRFATVNKADMVGLQHPFVSRSSNRNWNHWENSTTINNSNEMSLTWDDRGLCLGNVQTEMYKEAWKINIVNLATLARMWLSQYHVTRTGPLNNIRESFFGSPAFLTEEVRNVVGVIDSPGECRLPTQTRAQQPYQASAEFSVSYCKKINCLLKHSCDFYNRNANEDYAFMEEQSRVDYVQWILDHTAAECWPYGTNDVVTALQVYIDDANSGDIEPEDDIFYWDFREIRHQLALAKNDWEDKQNLAEKYQMHTGCTEARKQELVLQHTHNWFAAELARYKVNLDESDMSSEEKAIRESMIRWAASQGGI
tara:strand:+ start:25666 stop:27333 length:1668 start_codon:yes stop_codon:yes gene_type:complete